MKRTYSPLRLRGPCWTMCEPTAAPSDPPDQIGSRIGRPGGSGASGQQSRLPSKRNVAKWQPAYGRSTLQAGRDRVYHPSNHGWTGTNCRGTETMRLSWRWLIVPTVSLGLIAGLQLAALATTASSSIVTYWGPVLVQGNYWCGQVQSTVDDNVGYNGSARSSSISRFGANCGNSHTVPAGYLGAQVRLVRSNGTLCGSTPWSTNGSSTSVHFSTKTLSPTSSCPLTGTYRSDAHAEHWSPAANVYRVSNWVSSPYIPFS
jgi:hypothetical protein